jgi:acyl transferase domain-containing protein
MNESLAIVGIGCRFPGGADNARVLTGRAEPIALIGIGCRFPGCADDARALARHVHERVQEALAAR